MWELDCEEGWMPKNWCFWPVVLEKTLENPLDCKEIKSVNVKGNESWISIRRTDAEAEALILWPRDAKSWLTRKDPNAGTDWRQKEKGTVEDEMVGWHHRLNGHESEQTSGDGEGLESLACCSSWDRRVRHYWATERQQIKVMTMPSDLGCRDSDLSVYVFHLFVTLTLSSLYLYGLLFLPHRFWQSS